MTQRQRIKDLADFGAAPGGYEINFSLRTEDGSTMRLSCPQEQLGQVIVGLLRAQDMAGRERAKAGDSRMLLSAPMKTVELAVGVSPGALGILLQLKGQTGLVLDFELPVELAEQLSDGIPQAIRWVESGRPTEPTH